MNISYENLYLKSIEIETLLQKKGILSANSQVRFREYQNEVQLLSLAWKQKLVNNEDGKVKFGGLQVLALKELREIVELLEPVINTYDTLPENSKKLVKEKVSIILTGATYFMNEGKNTEARNFQFEFRLVAKFIEAGYKVHFLENPDIVVEIKGKRYAIECKRVTGKSQRSIQVNLESAIDQLIRNKEHYYAGIVALDISALLDNRRDFLRSISRESAGNKVLDDMEFMLFEDFKRYQKLKKYSTSHIVALLYNYSGAYVIPNVDDVGWAQGTDILVFDKENPTRAKRFIKDFANYRNSSIME